VSTILAALAARYADWLALPAERTSVEIMDDPDDVRAMPVILHIERAQPPARTALLEAAAAAAVAVCLDPQAEPDGPWHDELLAWTSAHIRKVSRRARGAHWQAVTDLPGRTITVDEKTHRVYTVTSKFGAAPAATPEQPRPRPRIEPGSFALLVLEP